MFDECIETKFCQIVADQSNNSEDDEDEENIAFDSANKFDNTRCPIQLMEYFKYLETYYIGYRYGRTSKRKSPPYPPSVWSKYNSVLAGRYRTSNVSEQWHAAIQHSINTFGSIRNFIDWISQEDCLMDVRFKKDAMQIRVDTPEGPLEGGSRRISVRDRAEMLKNLVKRFGTMPNMSYLEAVVDLKYDRFK